MKYMSFILTIFIIITVIPSCSPETAPPEIEYITAEHYYEKRELLPSAEFRTIVNSNVIDWKDIYTTNTAIYALGMRKEPMEYALAVFDWEGNCLEIRKPPIFNYKDVHDFIWLEDGTVIAAYSKVGAYTDDKQPDSRIMHIGTDSTVISEYTYPNTANVHSVITPAKDGYTVLYDNTIWLLDKHLKCTRTYTIPVYAENMYSIENTVYLYNSDNVYALDLQTGQTNAVVVQNTVSKGYAEKYFMGTGYDLFTFRRDGIYGICAAEDGNVYTDSNADLLLSWLESELIASEIRSVSIHDPRHILVEQTDMVTDIKQPLLLVHIPNQTIVQKEEVTLLTFYQLNDNDFLYRLASSFNQNSQKYVLNIIEYDIWYAYKNYDEIEKTVFTELHSGNVPDILMFAEGFQKLYLNLKKQEYLLDLSDFQEQLTASAYTAMADDSELYQIPLHIQYNTMFTSTQTKSPVTVTDFTKAIAQLGSNEYLFPRSITGYLIDTIEYTYIDTDSKTCNFQTDTFAELLALCNHMEEYISPHYSNVRFTILDETHHQYTISGDTRFPAQLRSGQIQFLPYTLSTIDGLCIIKHLYEDTEYKICGYPGLYAIPNVTRSFSIFKDSDCPEGAIAFLQYALSDAVQTSDMLLDRNLPVTDSAWKYLMELSAFSYTYIDTTADNIPGVTPELIFYLEGKYTDKDDITDTGDLQFTYTAADKKLLQKIINSTDCGHMTDPTINEILQEEIYAYRSGDRTLQDTIRILTSRISTYLAE